MTESGYVEHMLGHPVVKVFNNIYAKHLLENGKPAGAPGRIALPISGDDPKAKATVTRLIDARDAEQPGNLHLARVEAVFSSKTANQPDETSLDQSSAC
jgi:predicted dinucleotide-binding enzyme